MLPLESHKDVCMGSRLTSFRAQTLSRSLFSPQGHERRIRNLETSWSSKTYVHSQRWQSLRNKVALETSGRSKFSRWLECVPTAERRVESTGNLIIRKSAPEAGTRKRKQLRSRLNSGYYADQISVTNSKHQEEQRHRAQSREGWSLWSVTPPGSALPGVVSKDQEIQFMSALLEDR